MLGWKVISRIGAGPVQVSPHGIGIAAGYLVGARLFARRVLRRGIEESHAWNIAAWGVAGAILGARIAYVVGHLEDFDSPLDWLRIWEGGISLIGGLLGGIAAGWLYIRRHGLDFFDIADAGATGLALGVAIGRTGDLAIGDHLGKQTSGWWGWVYRGGELISPPPCTTPAGEPVYTTPTGCIETGIAVHQTALYDALWALAIFLVLRALERQPRRRGILFLTWGGLYAAGRIVTDFLRVDKTWVLGLTGSQITSVVALVVCGVLLLALGRSPRGQAKPAPAAGPAVSDGAAEEVADLPEG